MALATAYTKERTMEMNDSFQLPPASSSSRGRIESEQGLLQTCDNPIYSLYLAYGPTIQDPWRIRLLQAAVMEAVFQPPKLISEVFDVVNSELASI